jgi:DNA-binding transcriptional regulator YhcF (GntR family)
MNPMTVSKVYGHLVREGVLERRPGLALVVAERSGSELAAERRAELAQRLAPVVSVVRQLGLDDDEALQVFQRLLAARAASQEKN